tara:strand:+ start:2543 stop:2713 length:171 start_codon:yes stop_codon:yes gene_type:complete
MALMSDANVVPHLFLNSGGGIFLSRRWIFLGFQVDFPWIAGGFSLDFPTLFPILYR